MGVTGGFSENRFLNSERHRELHRLNGRPVFMEGNNVFLTPQMGQERCMEFVRATGVSRGSYSKVSDFFNSIG
jgi:hypothetical protein